MPSTKKRKPYDTVQLFCRSCRFRKGVRLAKKIFEGSYQSGSLKSRGLSSHLSSSNNGFCREYYEREGLIKYNENNTAIIDFSTSLVNPPAPTQPQKRSKYSAEQMGLPITTANGPQGRTQRAVNLDNLVTYNPMQPELDRKLIEAELDQSVNIEPDGLDDCTDFPEADHNSRDGESGVGVTLEQANQQHISQSIAPMEAVVAPTPHLVAEIQLMNLMVEHKMSLNAYRSIFNWARNSQSMDGFDFASRSTTTRGRKRIIHDINSCLVIPDDGFVPKPLAWLPDKKIVQLKVRPFLKAINSLLTNPELVKEEHFSFPDERNPYAPRSLSPVCDGALITELHHGKWWGESWTTMCKGEKDILVPVILYMDGISLDAHGKLSLTPLNMTLGIFNTAARKMPCAWETLYFHPDHDVLTALQRSAPKPIDNVKNLHNALSLALESFKEISELEEGVSWNFLPYAGQQWEVKMKFAIAFVVGDTEMHDKLCGHYKSKSTKLQSLCRHCNIPTKHLVTLSKQAGARLNEPIHVNPTAQTTEEYFKSISHHPIKNAFHRLNFGSANPYNIHLATPGECLHMHQLGVAKRAVESIEYWVFSRAERKAIQEKKHKRKKGLPAGKRGKTFLNFQYLAQQYGAQISRQSDRDFPRTKFTNRIFAESKKEGKDYAGVILCAIIAMLSDEIKELLQSAALITSDKIYSQVRTFELILGMEEFLKHGRLRRGKDELEKLKKTIYYFIQQVVRHIKRDGAGQVLCKNHLYFHIPKYIEMWGPPTGWDSAPCESHHKTEVKAPSKNTQRTASSLIDQTIQRQRETRTIRRARHTFNLNPTDTKFSPIDEVHGARFSIFVNDEGRPAMKWACHYRNKDRGYHPDDVIQFCCDHVLPIVDGYCLQGFTEHYRTDLTDGTQCFFRCHPSYRSSSGQIRNVWYDWALFNVAGEEIPCQILCLLDIQALKESLNEVRGYEVNSVGSYAVVQRFKGPPQQVGPSTIVKEGSLMEGLYLFSCDSILSELTVVPHITGDQRHRKHFVIANRTAWLDSFYDTMNRNGKKTLTELCGQDEVSTDSDDDVTTDEMIDDTAEGGETDDEAEDTIELETTVGSSDGE